MTGITHILVEGGLPEQNGYGGRRRLERVGYSGPWEGIYRHWWIRGNLGWQDGSRGRGCTLDKSSAIILTRKSLWWTQAIIVVGSVVFESAAWSSGNLLEYEV